jgi:hypothetical protein
MADHYILDENGKPRPADLMTWARWFETADRKVWRTALAQPAGVEVSTVFLGLDHSYGEGPPVLWETMVFGGVYDTKQWRYCTKQEALDGHRRAVQIVTGETDDE